MTRSDHLRGAGPPRPPALLPTHGVARHGAAGEESAATGYRVGSHETWDGEEEQAGGRVGSPVRQRHAETPSKLPSPGNLSQFFGTTSKQKNMRVAKRKVNHVATPGSYRLENEKPVEEDDDDEEDEEMENVEQEVKKQYRTKRVKKEQKRKEQQDKLERLKEGKRRVQNGEKCRTVARELHLPESTLRDFVKSDESKPFKAGRGAPRSKVLTEAEEKMVEEMVEKRRRLGYGMNYHQLQKALQVLLTRLCQKDPARVSGFEGSNQLPHMAYVYRFVARRSVLSLRAGMELSNSRAAVSKQEVDQWFKNLKETVLVRPGVAAALLDPSRVCNMVSPKHSL
jgi:hypothetical protein